MSAPEPDILFTTRPLPRIVCGAGAIDTIGRLAAEFGGHRALIVSDPGIVATGAPDRVAVHLMAEGIKPTVFDGVVENPTTDEVDLCVQVAKHCQADLIIGLGGGSSLDTAKGCNFIFTNGGRMEDYRGKDQAKKKMLPFIAVPTTAGTGSECQCFALIADPVTHQKMPCGDVKAMAVAAVLDPDLTLTQPPLVTACTGLDALAHAVESYVCKVATPWSRTYSGRAYQLIRENLPLVLAHPENREARQAIQLGASLAGAAIENSMLGCAHAAANPLTARFGVVHGHAVALLLPPVIRRNAEDPATAEAYRELLAGAGTEAASGREAALTIADEVEQWIGLTGLSPRLVACGVVPGAIPGLAEGAATQWTANFNPRAYVEADFESVYREAFGESAVVPSDA
ncbi:MAG: iron-containing alcohol dehydrogenase [Verrucomicrobiota bacterium]